MKQDNIEFNIIEERNDCMMLLTEQEKKLACLVHHNEKRANRLHALVESFLSKKGWIKHPSHFDTIECNIDGSKWSRFGLSKCESFDGWEPPHSNAWLSSYFRKPVFDIATALEFETAQEETKQKLAETLKNETR